MRVKKRRQVPIKEGSRGEKSCLLFAVNPSSSGGVPATPHSASRFAVSGPYKLRRLFGCRIVHSVKFRGYRNYIVSHAGLLSSIYIVQAY